MTYDAARAPMQFGAQSPQTTQKPAVAIFDDFDALPSGDHLNHGSAVFGVLQDQMQFSGAGIFGFDTNDPAADNPGITPPEPASIRDEIVAGNVDLLNGTSNGLEKVINSSANIKTINQSQSNSPLKTTDFILRKAADNPKYNKMLLKELGLPPDVSLEEKAQAVADYVTHVVETDGTIQQAQARYDQLSGIADQQGIIHVIAAGNQNEAFELQKELGIKPNAAFTHSNLENSHTITIGATMDGVGTAPEAAPFSNENPNVTVSADGFEVSTNQGPQNGTSFSSPIVAATVADIKQINPNLTTDQVKAILTQAAEPAPGQENFLGAGVLDPNRALLLAQQTV